jgi:hypothetical protein
LSLDGFISFAVEVIVKFGLPLEPADGAHADGALQKSFQRGSLEVVVFEDVTRGRWGAGSRNG